MTAVIFFRGDTPNTSRRWPVLLCAIDGVVQYPLQNDGKGNVEMVRKTLEKHPDHTPVYVVVERAAQGARFLEGYRHPEKAVYIFGPDHGTIEPLEGSERVTIVLSRSGRSLFSDHAGAMVLYHRRLQRGDWS